eukprot:m.46015 g.46015  ORF g.46015 m.46015 type:complete len:681 (+) comp11823_c0_seq3:72-2114(+)
MAAMTTKTAFLTDVEGNWEYFCRYVGLSDALSFTDGTNGLGAHTAMDLDLADGYNFVFGGDAGDKGNGTLRFVETMVRLKHKYPGRVTLLLGNRDVNKMRFTSELADDEIDNLDAIPGPYWVAEAKRVTPAAFVRKVALKALGLPPDTDEDVDLTPFNTKANRVRWMLKETMGSDGDFERRAEELAIMGDKPVSDVTENEVVASFLNSVALGGCIRNYLELGQLAHIVDNTLFVHGGVIGNFGSVRVPDKKSTDNLGYVPGRSSRFTDLHAWVSALNSWASTQVRSWITAPNWKEGSVPSLDRRDRGGDDFIDYVVPGCEPSVILARHLDKSGMPQPVPEAVAQQLLRSGIERVLVGHTPHGNCPTLIKTPVAGTTRGLLVVMADTSYSDMKAEDNRGFAVSDVTVLDRDSTKVQGVIETQEKISYTLSLENLFAPQGDQLIGTLLPDDEEPRFVKARMVQDEAEYLLCHVKGYTTKYYRSSAGDVREILDIKVAPVRQASSSDSFTATTAILLEDRDASDNRRALLSAMFERLDQNTDGAVDLLELRSGVEQCPSFGKLVRLNSNTPAAEQEMAELFAGIDTDNSGQITQEEFVAFFDGQPIKPSVTLQEAAECLAEAADEKKAWLTMPRAAALAVGLFSAAGAITVASPALPLFGLCASIGFLVAHNPKASELRPSSQ